MRTRLDYALSVLFVFVLGVIRLHAVIPPPPGSDPSVDPTGGAGGLKATVETGGSYDSHSGNTARSVTDVHVPGALGVYGFEFTWQYNSTATRRFLASSSF